MTEYPHLLFPAPRIRPRERRSSLPSRKLHVPAHKRQAARIESKLRDLESAFESERTQLQATAVGAFPEQVVVLEIAGSINDFSRALSRTDLKLLGDWDADDIPPDEDFYYYDAESGKASGAQLPRHLYLIMANQLYVKTLLQLWKQWERDSSGGLLRRGYKKWRDIFDQLLDVRLWSIEDRINETGLRDVWRENNIVSQAPVRFEVEFWYRRGSSSTHRTEVLTQFSELLARDGGRIVGQDVLIEQIAYHGVIAELPALAIERFMSAVDSVMAFRFPELMFLRPTGQMFAPASVPESLTESQFEGLPERPQGPPVVAFFDGLPLENHKAYAEALIVDDPEGWGVSYSIDQRRHGTATASLLVCGDLEHEGEVLRRPVYCRPILRPDDGSLDGGREALPSDILAVDLLHSAVRRLFEPVSDDAPTAPSVRIINLSIGDACQPFIHTMSPMARLLDWLSWKYGVLFIVSAGNHPTSLELSCTLEQFKALREDERDRIAFEAIVRDARHRRILAPAESINAITVGALNADACGPFNVPNPWTHLLLSSSDLPGPYSGVGHGYHGAVKPDVLAPGGRQLFREPVTSTGTDSNAVLVPVGSSARPPGIRVAAPGVAPGDIAYTIYSRGTSNATALVTRSAAMLHDQIEDLATSQNASPPIGGEMAALLKAMIVHSASWGEGFTTIENTLRDRGIRQIRANVSRFLGYGQIRTNRVMASDDRRVTILGFGTIDADEVHEFEFPMPHALGSLAIKRRLTATLGWLSPISPQTQRYRQAAVSLHPTFRTRSESGETFSANLPDSLGINRLEVDSRATVRGTVQHEIFEGDKATPFLDGDCIAFEVQCREETGKDHLEGPVPYALVCTLEIPALTDIRIYEEVRSLVRASVREQVRQPIRTS